MLIAHIGLSHTHTHATVMNIRESHGPWDFAVNFRSKSIYVAHAAHIYLIIHRTNCMLYAFMDVLHRMRGCRDAEHGKLDAITHCAC